MEGPRLDRSELVTFLLESKCLMKKSSTGILTHTLLDGRYGGCVYLPDSALGDFIDAYGKDLLRSRKLYVVERRTKVFKMHFDLDFKTVHDDATTEALLEEVRTVVLSFLEPGLERESWCIACAVLEGTARKAPGVHLIFPWLLVDAQQAQWMRSAVVRALGALESWEAVVDSAVFASAGLRMVGSDKCRDCPTCGNGRETRLFCGACKHQGRVPENKVYWPWRVFPLAPAQELCRDIQANGPYGVHVCSTRVPRTLQRATQRFRAPPGAPPRPLAISRECGRSESLQLTSGLEAALRQALVSHNRIYALLKLASLERYNESSLRLRVRGEGSRFCQNKQGEHAKSTVYFVLNEAGLVQRCYSRKQLLRNEGLCAHYASPPTALCPELLGLCLKETRAHGCAGRELERICQAKEKGKSGRPGSEEPICRAKEKRKNECPGSEPAQICGAKKKPRRPSQRPGGGPKRCPTKEKRKNGGPGAGPQKIPVAGGSGLNLAERLWARAL